MSLVEVLVAMTILSIGVLGFVGSFTYITKAIRVSRARTLATNLAQEKVENLKNEPYYKLSLTTVTVSHPSVFPAISYDNLNYGLEVINIGGIKFERGVLVAMAQVTDGAISSVGYNYPDTGMKKITVYVIWQSNADWKYIELQNVYENPVVDPLTGQVSGLVVDGSSDPVEGALVRVVENADWSDTTASDGSYSIAAQPGTYSLKASSAGWYDTLITEVNLSSTSPEGLDFKITQIGSGTVTGRAWTNPNLLISHIQLATHTLVGNNVPNTRVEFVQLFNPTTYAINIGAGGVSDTKLSYYNEHTPSGYDEADFLDGETHVSTYVPSLKHYLIASSSFFFYGDKFVHADAYYSAPEMRVNDAGSIQITRVSDNYQWDAVGWDDLNPLTNYANHIGKYEGTPIDNGYTGGTRPPQCQGDGLNGYSYPSSGNYGWSAVRFSTPADINDTWGPAYDSGDNNADFLSHVETCLLVSTAVALSGLRNTSDSAKQLISGVPMFDAYITADDLLGPATNAYLVAESSGIFGTTVTLTSNVAYFSLAGVSTGTWNVVVASDSYSATISNVEVVQNVSTGIPNGVSEPTWLTLNYSEVNLTTQSANGYISGVISDISGDPIAGIEILAGGETKTTGANGRYFASVTSGSIFVTANPNNVDTRFVESVQSATIETGVLSTADFTLTEGGIIKGFCSTDGTSILPNVQFAATISGAQYGLATSDDSGNFYIRNLTTGTYDVAPILDPMETWSPLSTSTYVSPGTTVDIGTFTISGALGTLAGTVTTTGNTTVTSGALILVSENAIPATPTEIVASSSPAQTPIYAASSLADGTYSVDVRGSTSTTYNVSVYIPTINGSNVSITTKTYSGVSITADNTTSLDLTAP
jgi:type II secretory pathway pseudopilin PulG